MLFIDVPDNMRHAGEPKKQQQPVSRKLQPLQRKLSAPAGKHSVQNPRASKMNRHKL